MNFKTKNYILNVSKITEDGFIVYIYKRSSLTLVAHPCDIANDDGLKNLNWAKHFERLHYVAEMLDIETINLIKSDLNRIEKLIAFQ